ncbi:bifunctional DNA primase/polymerase [Bosea rubneri]|uniref:Bifunctional DNA primase/polymerase n=1 Tax=Bosea rubneri TaxID=3075434 RepID=A0ABU3SE14_9HYPH|nr:bifunctional DNA primase/polymerase [Bosea sp. ZW T0_25]MDU0343030.1 bifunctional DNA primase/polymerase [Bosea sp. ZW T0_25]
MVIREPKTYGDAEPRYRVKNMVVVPLAGKGENLRGWADRFPSQEEIAKRHRLRANFAFGLLSGTRVGDDVQLGFFDIDHNGAVAFVRAMIGTPVVEKVGSKGATFFVRLSQETKSSKTKRPGDNHPVFEVMANTGMTVMPESPHPSGARYRWIGKSLLAVDLTDLPFVDQGAIDVIKAVLQHEHAWQIIEGGPSVAGHEPMLTLTACGIASMMDDLPRLANALGELFQPGYSGNTKGETLGMLESARAKQLGRRLLSRAEYDPGEFGPRPLGFTADGSYALLDPARQIIVVPSSQQLLSMQWQIGLAPSEFWAERFPAKKAAYNSMAAGEALIAAARKKGPFKPDRVRGRGVWREGDEIIVNFGHPIVSKRYHYLCFMPIELKADGSFDARRLLRLLEAFNWRDVKDAMLMLGWLALAPICGALDWRTHAFVFGPARSGKTTLHHIAAALLEPVAVKADGQSTEAGIRQALGPDSLPVMLDEFESDQHAHKLQAVLRLARSASSANTPVLRGTPEGKAIQFNLRTTFLFAAINPRGMSQADQSRIVMLELLMHDNSSEKARFILSEEAHFRSLGDAWCSYMVARAADVVTAIDKLEQLIPSGDRRHRQNMATLLGAGFIALHARVPTDEEAAGLAQEFASLVERHAEEIERDDAQECLDHLFAQVHDANTLGMWVAEARAEMVGKLSHGNAEHILDLSDMRLYDKQDGTGLVIRHGSPAIDKLFRGTRWADGAWQRALRKLDGAFVPQNPVQFRSAKAKARGIGIPVQYLPEQLPDDKT